MSNPRTLPTAALLLHEQAHLVPEMHPDEYKPFAADVKKRGVQEPIKLIPGTKTVIDGRTRLKAATDAGLPSVPVEDADLGDLSPVAYMLHKALYRRNLKPGQRAALGNEIAKQLRADARQRQKDGAVKGGATTAAKVKGEPSGTNTGSLPPTPAPSTNGKKNRGGETAVVAAQIAGSNSKHVRQAGQIEQKAPEVYEQVKAGVLSVPAAVEKVKEQERAAGTLLSKLPNFPGDALAILIKENITTVEHLDARVAELRKQPGRDGVGRFNVLRDVGLNEKLVKKVGDVLDGHTATAAAPKPAPLVKTRPATEELKSCPFCGSTDVALVSLGIYVHCRACMACGPSPKDPTPAESCAAWNARAKLVVTLHTRLRDLLRRAEAARVAALEKWHAGATVETLLGLVPVPKSGLSYISAVYAYLRDVRGLGSDAAHQIGDALVDAGYLTENGPDRSPNPVLAEK